jgi:hypothetical protein
MLSPTHRQSTNRESRFAQLMSAQLLIDVDETEESTAVSSADESGSSSKTDKSSKTKAGEAPHPEEKLVR